MSIKVLLLPLLLIILPYLIIAIANNIYSVASRFGISFKRPRIKLPQKQKSQDDTPEKQHAARVREAKATLPTSAFWAEVSAKIKQHMLEINSITFHTYKQHAITCQRSGEDGNQPLTLYIKKKADRDFTSEECDLMADLAAKRMQRRGVKCEAFYVEGSASSQRAYAEVRVHREDNTTLQ
jgi:hypothetical protein